LDHCAHPNQPYLNSFHDDEVDDEPGADEAEEHPPLDADEVVDAAADVLQKKLSQSSNKVFLLFVFSNGLFSTLFQVFSTVNSKKDTHISLQMTGLKPSKTFATSLPTAHFHFVSFVVVALLAKTDFLNLALKGENVATITMS